MLNFLCKIDAPSTVGDKFGVGLIVALIGTVVVFIVLVILILCLKLINITNAKIESKKAKNGETPEHGGADAFPNVTVDASIDCNSTVAAIVGALNVVLSDGQRSDNSDTKFVVRSIKKFNSRR